MTRRFIAQLGEQEKIDEVFLVSEKQLRSNRNGNLYLQMRLSDKTGSVTGMLWNANDHLYGLFENGDYLRVQATSQVYNGAVQFIVSKIERVSANQVDEADFITLGDQQIVKLQARLRELLRSMESEPLRNLAEAFLTDDSFLAKFSAAPAGVKHHHAYKGGLLEHVVSLMELCRVVAPRYDELNGDLLLMGALLHDAGKIEELVYQRELGYSDEGQLIGHVVMGVVILEQKLREYQELVGEAFPTELALRLKHMIVSHHGHYEFGSPKLPMTLEAVALHHLDDLDAKMFSLAQIMRDDANTDSPWTPFQANLQRKLFKGSAD